jgi:hypothetical protein
VLVDTGIGSQLPGMAGRLQPRLAALNLRPEDIDIVLRVLNGDRSTVGRPKVLAT